MIGNDIVDLQLAGLQSNWQRKGWLQKIYTDTEQELILISENPELQVWKFWSMKEAAYKAHQRRFLLFPRYNPKKFECELDGTVNISNFTYKVTTTCTDQYVYSIATNTQVKYTSKVFDKQQNARILLKQYIANTLANTSLSAITIAKNQNQIPFIKINDVVEDVNFSLTHHGLYAAFIIAI